MKKLLIYLIKFYQKYLSPMKRTRCPYIPTCSSMVWKRFRNTELSEEVFWLYGESYGVILFQKADMIPFHEEEFKECY